MFFLTINFSIVEIMKTHPANWKIIIVKNEEEKTTHLVEKAIR